MQLITWLLLPLSCLSLSLSSVNNAFLKEAQTLIKGVSQFNGKHIASKEDVSHLIQRIETLQTTITEFAKQETDYAKRASLQQRVTLLTSYLSQLNDGTLNKNDMSTLIGMIDDVRSLTGLNAVATYENENWIQKFIVKNKPEKTSEMSKVELDLDAFAGELLAAKRDYEFVERVENAVQKAKSFIATNSVAIKKAGLEPEIADVVANLDSLDQKFKNKSHFDLQEIKSQVSILEMSVTSLKKKVDLKRFASGAIGVGVMIMLISLVATIVEVSNQQPPEAQTESELQETKALVENNVFVDDMKMSEEEAKKTLMIIGVYAIGFAAWAFFLHQIVKESGGAAASKTGEALDDMLKDLESKRKSPKQGGPQFPEDEEDVFDVGGKKNIRFGVEKTITFKDVAGLGVVMDEFTLIVDMFVNSSKYKKLNANIPKGIMLTGPPGNGKTLIGRAIAGELKAPFLYINAAEFAHSLHGVGRKQVEDIFGQARRIAKIEGKCVIFIDEVDGVAKERGAKGNSGAHDEILNMLLSQMDGIEANGNILVVAATNRPDVLDSAFTRAGRFDRVMEIDLPDLKARAEIFQVHLNKKGMIEGDIPQLAQYMANLTDNLSGAAIANVCNTASIIAAKENSQSITKKHLIEAWRTEIVKKKAGSVMTPEQKEIRAYHEAAKATVAWVLKNKEKPNMISVFDAAHTNPRQQIRRKQELVNYVKQLLAPKMADEEFLNDTTTDVSPVKDFHEATQLIQQMVTMWGMSDMKLEAFGLENDAVKSAASKLQLELMEETRVLLKSNKRLVETVAQRLKESEFLTYEDLQEIFEGPLQLAA